MDVVGTALLGHNFQALQTSEDSFVDHFNRVMSRIATPMRLIFPFLDDWFPRHAVVEDVNSLNARYDGLLQMKRQDLGQDLLSYLLDDSTLSNEELRSNLAILFSAGHVRNFFLAVFSWSQLFIGHDIGGSFHRDISPCKTPRAPIKSTR